MLHNTLIELKWPDVERTVSYFRCCGEANTEKVLGAIRRRCEERGPGIVVVAKQLYRVRRLPEYKFENWEGDLDKYYPE
jgi:hypothetical protein